MFAQQWKAGQGMIEGHLFLPADRIVAALAIRSELALVDIIICMATQAGHGQLDDAWRLLVASTAYKGLMGAAQRKAGHRIVVETALLPVAAVMAARAIRAIAALVDIVLDMAGDASS